MISPDDPRLTAYASGDLPPDEVARFEAELAQDPAARAHVDELRALQTELTASFAAEPVEPVEHTTPAEPIPFAEPAGWRLAYYSMPLAIAASVALVVAAMVVPTVGKVRESATRSVASSNLRQIGQACLIYASDNQDTLPVATDVWNFAAHVARGGGLNDATIWTFGADPANAFSGMSISTVLTSDHAEILPSFKKLIPAYAVPLGTIKANMPPTIPIAWTRGLRADGTWSTHSPYGTSGGHIVFLGGNVHFYRDVKNELVRFSDGAPTSNILEALPPGTLIGEYVPSVEEEKKWARSLRFQKTASSARKWALPALWCLTLLVLLVQAIRGRWSFSLVLWFLVLSGLLALLIPTVC